MVRFIWGGNGDLTRDKADSFRAKIGESDVDIVLHTQNNGTLFGDVMSNSCNSLFYYFYVLFDSRYIRL